jgi:hypothetical protein
MITIDDGNVDVFDFKISGERNDEQLNRGHHDHQAQNITEDLRNFFAKGRGFSFEPDFKRLRLMICRRRSCRRNQCFLPDRRPALIMIG